MGNPDMPHYPLPTNFFFYYFFLLFLTSVEKRTFLGISWDRSQEHQSQFLQFFTMSIKKLTNILLVAY